MRCLSFWDAAPPVLGREAAGGPGLRPSGGAQPGGHVPPVPERRGGADRQHHQLPARGFGGGCLGVVWGRVAAALIPGTLQGERKSWETHTQEGGMGQHGLGRFLLFFVEEGY